MRKSIIVMHEEDTLRIQLRMVEPVKDQVGYLEGEIKRLVESRHMASSDDADYMAFAL